MTPEEKYVSYYVLLTDQISLCGYLYLVRYFTIFFNFFSNTIFNSQDIERFVFLNSCA